MDNNENNFKEQFVQNVKTSTPQPAAIDDKPSRANLIVMIVLVVVMVIQTVFLTATLVNLFPLLGADEEEEEEELPDDSMTAYKYDDGGMLTAIGATCNMEDGSSYILSLDNNYEKQNSSSETTASGTYSIEQDLVINLKADSDSETLFYNGYTLSDGNNFYACEENLE